MSPQELANIIWDIKEIIRNLYDDAEVEDVILPFTLLRRLDCVLDDKRQTIMSELKGLEGQKAELKLKSLMYKHKLSFFNTSGLSLELLLGNPEQMGQHFETYLNGFTQNVRDILANFVSTDSSSEQLDLSPIWRKLERHNKLFAVVQLFVQRADLHPERVSNAMMGTIFEIVIRRSKEASNTKAGQFYTPREIVRLLVALTFSSHEEELHRPGRLFTVYDPCCGTGGMLTESKAYLQELTHNPSLGVYLYGQELNEKTYAICKSDLLMKGDDKDLELRICQGNTLCDDKHIGKRFNFMLANPPFGVDWGKDEQEKARIQQENCLGGRFEAGLPSTSDGSLLFLQHMISKMDEEQGSRIGIILNGSPLFNGDAGSGWSNIRKMLLDRNLLDAIIALPKDLFYGTNIGTYLWILDNKRPAERHGKVLMVNAAHAEYTSLLAKNLGKKRYEISEEGMQDILDIYTRYESCSRPIVYDKTGETEELEVARLMDYDDFLYTKVTVRRPLRLRYEGIGTKARALLSDETLKLSADDRKALASIVEVEDIDSPRHDEELFAYLRKVGLRTPKTKMVAPLRKHLGERCEDAPAIYDTPGKPESGFVTDTALNDSESIPYKENIDEYFAREVLPFTPDAWLDRNADKIGCEFPFTKLFYRYRPMRPLQDILADIAALDKSADEALSTLEL